jgi:hypothetical protein
MVEKEKIYLCSTNDLDRAALLYDLTIIQIKGLQSKTNFNYNAAQLCAMLFLPSLLQMKLEEVIALREA